MLCQSASANAKLLRCLTLQAEELAQGYVPINVPISGAFIISGLEHEGVGVSNLADPFCCKARMLINLHRLV